MEESSHIIACKSSLVVEVSDVSYTRLLISVLNSTYACLMNVLWDRMSENRSLKLYFVLSSQVESLY